jgi:tetratricopeptide (TPR) repeat protein
MRAAVVLAIVLVGTSVRAHAAPDNAQAQPDDDERARAKEWYVKATRHYDLGEYAEAVKAYRRAYKLLPEPLFLFDIAQAYRLDHKCDDARAAYKSYLRKLPTADNREKVEHFIAEMDECVQEEEERKIARERAQQELTAAAAVAPPRNRTLLIAGIVTAGVGAVVGSSGIYFSLDASAQARRLEALCATQVKCDGADVAAVDLQGRQSNRDAIVLYSVGGIALASGIGMILWATFHTPQSVTVTPAPDGATVSTMVRF